MLIAESREVGQAETLVECVQRLDEFTREAVRLGKSLHCGWGIRCTKWSSRR